MSEKNPEVPYFDVRDLCKAFGGTRVLNGVTVTIPKGKTTVILGGSGQGKSVLLKHLNGLIQPDTGTIHVDGTEIGEMSEEKLAGIRRNIGILFQDGALFDSMTVAENVAFPLREQEQVARSDIARLVYEMLDRVDLSKQGDKMPGTLSGGMRKRVGLARAMVTSPRCLLCDEPTAGLDPVLADTVSELIRKTATEGKLTAVAVTHDLGSMRLMADHVVFLAGGKISFSGTPNELADSTDPDIKEFLSRSSLGG